jgi:hypothetical protein
MTANISEIRETETSIWFSNFGVERDKKYIHDGSHAFVKNKSYNYVEVLQNLRI